MDDTIRIYNPSDKPFGVLSNNAMHYMKIDDEKWKSVSNYIYTKMLTVPGYKMLVKNSSPTKAKELFSELYLKTINNTFASAAEKALDVKFEDSTLKELLVSTGTVPLVYWSQDPILGAGADGKGRNLLGKYMSQIRHRLEVSYSKEKELKAKDDRKTHIYNTYVATEALRKSMMDGNDLTEYANLSADEIIDKYGRDKIMNMMPTRDAVLFLHRKNLLGDVVKAGLANPTMLATGVRKEGIERLRTSQMKKRRKIVMDMYADEILKKEYPDLEKEKYEQAREQQYTEVSKSELADLEDKLYELYSQGLLPEKLTGKIDRSIVGIFIPSEEEVNMAKAMPLTIEEQQEEVITRHYRPEAGKPIYFGDDASDTQTDPKYAPFGPGQHTDMLVIEGYAFPSVIHYIFCELLALLQTVRTLGNAYKYSLRNPNQTGKIIDPNDFISPNDLVKKYFSMRDKDYVENIKKYLTLAIKEKFSDMAMGDVLLLTEDRKILWNDKEDPVLGVGENGKGENFVGKLLMDTRKSVREARKYQQVPKISVDDIETFVQTDSFMKSWFEMRLRDMCNIISLMKTHIYSQTKEQYQIDSKFVSTVLDKIYQPCSALYVRAGKVNTPAPRFVKYLLNKCPGFKDCLDVGEYTLGKKLCPDVAEVIWRRMAILLQYLIQYKEASTVQNIRTILARVEQGISQQLKCDQIIGDPWKNCILSALINLLKGINKFNKSFAYSSVINQRDIFTAISIIIGEQYKKVKVPKTEPEPEPEAQVEYVSPSILSARAREIMERLTRREGKTEDKDSSFDLEKAIEGMDAPPVISRPRKDEEESDSESDSDDDSEFDAKSEQEFVFPSEEETREEDEDEDDDYGYDVDDYGVKDDLEERYNILSIINHDFDQADVEDAEKIVDMLLTAVDSVNDYKMSKKIKTNRVNFFASIL